MYRTDGDVIEEPVEEFGNRVIEVINSYGKVDFVFEDQPTMPVCSQCNCYVMPNRSESQGSICGECEHAFNIECEHDMADGLLW